MSAYTKELMVELEAIGVIKRNGQFRRRPDTGELEPVYVPVELPEEEVERRLRALDMTTETEQ
jgi:hypothetical protein